MGAFGPSHADLNPSTYPYHAQSSGFGPEPGETEPKDPGEMGPYDPSLRESQDEVEDQSVVVTPEDLNDSERAALAGDLPPVVQPVNPNVPDGEGGTTTPAEQEAEETAGEGEEEDQGSQELATSQPVGGIQGPDLDQLGKPDLQALLKQKGLPTSGNVPELRERLRNQDDTQA